MGISDFGSFVLKLQERREEYQKKHDKDKYIDYLEVANSELIKAYKELEDKYKKLQKSNEQPKSKFNDRHLKILSIASKEEDGINTYHLEQLYGEDPKYKISFSELKDWGYLEFTHAYGAALINQKTFYHYDISTDKETEVLKELGKADLL